MGNRSEDEGKRLAFVRELVVSGDAAKAYKAVYRCRDNATAEREGTLLGGRVDVSILVERERRRYLEGLAKGLSAAEIWAASPKDAPEDLSAAQLLQMGNELALRQCYQAMQNGTGNAQIAAMKSWAQISEQYQAGLESIDTAEELADFVASIKREFGLEVAPRVALSAGAL